VLIPQMLQSLYGYTATDAGLVLGPGAFVIVALAPVIVRILPKVGSSRSFSLDTSSLPWPCGATPALISAQTINTWPSSERFQGLGIAPLFVPVSQLAYSFLP